MDNKKERCRDCICLVQGDNGEWICDEKQMEINSVERCPEGMDDESESEVE
jgi:hypothetical protein